MRSKRLRQELRQISMDSDAICGSMNGRIQLFLSEVEPHVWKAHGAIEGPPPIYQEGIFSVRFEIPGQYPFRSPKLFFENKVWHPNVDFDTGLVVLDVFSTEWSTSWTLQHLLLAVWSVLGDPCLDRPINCVAASQYVTTYGSFVEEARVWTEVHAGVSLARCRWLIQHVAEMGFPVEMVESILKQENWNEDVAVGKLLQLTQADEDWAYYPNPSSNPARENSRI